MYPGYFCYHHRNSSRELDVFFTPDHKKPNIVAIEVYHDGNVVEAVDIPFTKRSAENLFHAVKPWHEKYEKGR